MKPQFSVFDTLLRIRDERGAGYLVLVDPDSLTPGQVARLAEASADAGVDAFLIGGSLLMSDALDATVKRLQEISGLPTLLFPGASNQLSRHADAILFLSLVSGRNPDFLIGEHVRAAPIIREYGLEAIPTAYLLIDGGAYTSVQFMSGTFPIPREKTEIAMAHALAAEYLGMKLIYLEGGSGAQWSVPEEMVSGVKNYVQIPIIVGGGITKPEMAAEKVRAGANFIVTGNVLEKGLRDGGNVSLLSEFAHAIHSFPR